MGDITKKGLYKKFITSVEKIWWVIPPVFLVFIYWPLFLAIPWYEHYIFEGSSWYVAIVKSIHEEFSVYWFKDIRMLFSFKDYEWIVPLFMFGSMSIGYIITKNMSLKYKILVPSILGMIGLLVGLFAGFIYYMGYRGGYLG